MARKSADTEKVLSTRVLVLIDQDLTTKTSCVVWQHEIPLLEVVHGEGTVTVLDPSVLDEGYNPKTDRSMLVHKPQGAAQDSIPRPSETQKLGYVFAGDPRSEYERLTSVYGTVHDADEDRNVSVVLKAYGRFNEGKFERVIGSPDLADLPDAQLKEVLHSYGEAIPDGATTSDLLKLAADANVELV